MKHDHGTGRQSPVEFKGTIDDLRLYNIALTPAEIEMLVRRWPSRLMFAAVRVRHWLKGLFR